VWFPIHDLNAPTLEGATPLLDDLVARIERGEHLLMHCAAGIGRTGTIAACILVRLGMDIDAALALLREVRPGAGPEVGTQLDLVKAVAAGPVG
jgi:protein-tyrosine phosphatase